ncbi:hypothetical protein GCM10023169_09170 [Georgenia halophila]|uniref:ABC-2 type transport system permease protein n=1 Tax=Georgenia halophila TaxID=620889 RepID=A0ABP8KZ04_9MICO
MVGLLIRLRFAIQSHTLPWKRFLGLTFGVVGVVLTWAAVIASEPAARHDVAVVALTMWFVGWLVGPILTSGASVLRPEYFTLLPLDGRRVGLGLLATVFVGVGGAITVLGLSAVVAYGVISAAWWAVLVAVVATVLFTVATVGLSRAVYALLGAAMKSRLGVELAAIQYGALIACMFAGWLVVAPVVTVVPVFLSGGLGGAPAAVLDRTPAGWAIGSVDAAAAGDAPGALGLLALLALFAAAAVVAAVHLLTPDVDGRASRRRLRPPTVRVAPRRPILPATPLGAVVGKELRTWWRDPWRSLEVRSSIWFGIFMAIFLTIAGAGDWAAWAAVAVCLMVAASGANLYGQDGTALWQLVVAQSPEAIRADVRGRQVGIVASIGLPAIALCGAITALTGSWDMAVLVLTAIVVVLGVGSGMSALLSVLAVTPGVDPARRANPTDAGENSLAIQVAMWLTMTMAVPTLLPLALHLFGGWGADAWWARPVLLLLALLHGGVVAWALGGIATRRLTARLPETFARLRFPTLRVAGASAGGGLLGAFERQTEKAAHDARKAAEGKRKVIEEVTEPTSS